MNIRGQYRQFLQAGYAAVDSVNKRHIKSLIRQGFENRQYLTDPEIHVKAENTLMLLNNASLRKGIERDIVQNLCQLNYFKDKDDVRPPFYNRKMPPHVKKLHDDSRKELELVIDMLNKDLKLCLM
ncbi:hypothetical protein [Parasitella parasitica]|uniref:Uncharacterized protein n=1 Tax=Parasitella parasitica TaxID=35722 RepID=A0A0B7NP01_9FUNG|nr:hypothetical protein [Parasitella parasitica]